MADDWSREQTRKFEVRVGRAVVTVRCKSAREAVRLARRLLCDDMPRMWDVIHGLDDTDFHVERARQ